VPLTGAMAELGTSCEGTTCIITATVGVPVACGRPTRTWLAGHLGMPQGSDGNGPRAVATPRGASGRIGTRWVGNMAGVNSRAGSRTMPRVRGGGLASVVSRRRGYLVCAAMGLSIGGTVHAFFG
jgi:hypothetical protein